jgi:hypothetical protein
MNELLNERIVHLQSTFFDFQASAEPSSRESPLPRDCLYHLEILTTDIIGHNVYKNTKSRASQHYLSVYS